MRQKVDWFALETQIWSARDLRPSAYSSMGNPGHASETAHLCSAEGTLEKQCIWSPCRTTSWIWTCIFCEVAGVGANVPFVGILRSGGLLQSQCPKTEESHESFRHRIAGQLRVSSWAMPITHLPYYPQRWRGREGCHRRHICA